MNQKNLEPGKRHTKQTRETLAERVHRHISDINSKITDDDIRNVKMELEIRSKGPATQPNNDQVNELKKKVNQKTKKRKRDDQG